MPLHIRKLCVGVWHVDELRQWQKYRLERGERLLHRTRNTPKRQVEIVDGGSLYWIIRGRYSLRQRILAFERESAEQVAINDPSKPRKPHCLLILDSDLHAVMPRPHRGFQGWRYLSDAEAPADIAALSIAEKDSLSAEMLQQLHDIGILV